MKATFYTLLGLTLLLTGCDFRKKNKRSGPSSATEMQMMANPTMVQVIDSIYDFGKVNEGELVQYNYRFRNIGKKPLVIQSGIASCGCTVPEKPEHPIAPGEIGFIKVTFNSERRPGEVLKTITISSNANPEFPELYLKGTVIGKTHE
jgi:hypothetical protein